MKNRITFAITPTLNPVAPDSTEPRGFYGLAYGGGVMENWCCGDDDVCDVIIDMSTLTTPEKFPALVDHESEKRAGYVNSWNADNNGLKVHGVLLSNKHGAGVAQDSDEGFPWQMSVGLDIGIAYRVPRGDSVLVNGKMLDGEILVLRNCKINEVSFTPVGYDSTTTATAFSKPNTPTEGVDMNLEEAKAELSAEKTKNEALKAENAKLAAENAEFSKASREHDIKGLFAKLGKEYSPSDAKAIEWAALPSAAFSAVKSALSDFTPTKLNPALFAHTVPTNFAPTPPAEADVVKSVGDKFIKDIGGKQ